MARYKKGRCSLYSVPCDDNLGCYTANDICDGIRACADGTDEKRCEMTTGSNDHTTSPTGCPSEATCLDFNDHRICLTDADLCDGVYQCREGFDESSCAPHRNPYILPTLVSLAGVLLIVIIMCIVYKLCVYRYTSASSGSCNRVNNDQSTSCSTVFLKRQCTEEDTRLHMHQLEPSDKSETSVTGVETCLTVVETESGSREQCVQFPSQDEDDDGDDEDEDDDGDSISSSTKWVSTTI